MVSSGESWCFWPSKIGNLAFECLPRRELNPRISQKRKNETYALPTELSCLLTLISKETKSQSIGIT